MVFGACGALAHAQAQGGRMILQANALRIPLADGSVHMCVTSPPYWGLRDYGVSDQIGLEATPLFGGAD